MMQPIHGIAKSPGRVQRQRTPIALQTMEETSVVRAPCAAGCRQSPLMVRGSPGCGGGGTGGQGRGSEERLPTDYVMCRFRDRRSERSIQPSVAYTRKARREDVCVETANVCRRITGHHILPRCSVACGHFRRKRNLPPRSEWTERQHLPGPNSKPYHRPLRTDLLRWGTVMVVARSTHSRTRMASWSYSRMTQ